MCPSILRLSGAFAGRFACLGTLCVRGSSSNIPCRADPASSQVIRYKVWGCRRRLAGHSRSGAHALGLSAHCYIHSCRSLGPMNCGPPGGLVLSSTSTPLVRCLLTLGAYVLDPASPPSGRWRLLFVPGSFVGRALSPFLRFVSILDVWADPCFSEVRRSLSILYPFFVANHSS